MPGLVKVLSVDGGGIRGVIPATILAEIERRAGAPISSLFDLVAGTSTGGILALGLTKPGADGRPQYAASELVDLYAAEGDEIFARSLWHRTRAAGSLLDEKYPTTGVEEVLGRYFGDARLKDSLTDVLVTAYEIERRVPWFFRSSRARTDPGYDFALTEVARATSAAPTYFEPAKLPSNDPTKPYWALVDGGVFANNPAMCALAEAMATHGSANEYLVCSLGTGEQTREIPYEDAKDWGLLGWARPILNVVFDGVADTVGYQVEQLCKETADTPSRYFRFQAELVIGNDDMDDASRTNIEALKTLGRQIVEEGDDRLDRLCEWLTQDGDGTAPAAAREHEAART